MKKKFKKIASLVLAVVMAFAMAVPAMASGPVEDLRGETFDIKIATTDADKGKNHAYKAYQIFKGDVSVVDGKDTLSNIEWGSGVNKENVFSAFGVDDLAALLDAWKGAEDADAIAKKVAECITGDGIELKFDGEKYSASGVEGGYYLIVDTFTTEGEAAEGEALSKYIVEVANDVDVKPKSSVPTVEKKVKEKDDTTGTTSGWQDGADYDIGDEDIAFQLTGTLPTNYDAYTTYKYVFHDTLSEGLTYNEDATVYLVSSDEALATDVPGEDITSHFVITNDGELKITCENLKAISSVKAGMKIVVRYTATLNEKAKFGVEGNPNTVYLEYSNNPNGEGEGKTPEDKVTVFTYKLTVKKVDGEEHPLEGAGFTLYKKLESGDEEIVGGVELKDRTEFTWEGLDSGKYRLEETTVPAGYNKAKDVEFEVVGEYDPNVTGGEAPKLKGLTIKKDGNPISELEGAEVPGSGATFKVSFGDGKDTEAKTNVVNEKGATLPETGGIGTTIFYVVGSVLVLAAVVLLVTKRRMNSK